MGTNKVEQKVKKMKKIRKREIVGVGVGRSSEVADLSKDDATEMNEVHVPAVELKSRKSKKLRSNKKKDGFLSNEESNALNDAEKHEPTEHDPSKGKKDKSNKIQKKKRKRAFVCDEHSMEVNNGEEIEPDVDGSKRKKDKSKKARKNKMEGTILSSEENTVVNDLKKLQPEGKDSSKQKKGKAKKVQKQRKTSHSTITEAKSVTEVQEIPVIDVYQIPSGENDDSKGMKKWIKEYHEKRPGIEVLQAQIDDFITAYEEQEEQAKREKEASLTEDGWTVVGRRKGGKKTTDSESGITVGAVAQSAVREKLANKKNKDVGLDFYRFQRKEANRSELMKLQSRFEEDKKRIQQLRAARKFKPN